MKRLTTAWLLALSLASAWADSAGLQQALVANDVLRLEQLAHRPGEQGALARAVALSLRHRDAEARPTLERMAASRLPVAERAAALQELSALLTRQGHYGAAARALDDADRLHPLDAEAQQARAFVAALAELPPMTVEPGPRARLAITRDAAGLARVDASAEGQAQQFVVDTGAAFSTVTESTARRLGLRLLDTEASVGTVSRDALRTRFAVGRELALGSAVLHDVVFIVLPDEALSFAGGAYRIEAILGLPVFLKLGRLGVEQGDGQETLSLGSAAPETREPANLMLSGVQPLLLARSETAGRTLRLFVDTGAKATHLFANAAQASPQLLRQARRQAHTLGGAGGSSTDDAARKLPALTLQVGTRRATLADVALLSRVAPDRDGAVGQDLLRQGRGYVMDFERMCLSLLP